MKTIVLGAGIVGTATAYFLAKQGHEVEVVERRSGAALETSFGNGGVIHASEVEPWSQPGMPRKILQWLGKENAPLLVRYGAIPHMWRWGLSFIANCTPERFRRNSLTNLRLALHSLKTLQGIRAETGIDYDLRTVGVLKIYTSRESFAAACAPPNSCRPGPGLRARGSRGMRRREPALQATSAPWSAESISPGTRSAIATSSRPRSRPAAPGSASDSTMEPRYWGWSEAPPASAPCAPVPARWPDNFVAALASFTPGVLRAWA
jgi:Predicted dehydrogenase